MSREITFFWKERDGTKKDVTVPISTSNGYHTRQQFQAARRRAKELGYPGHSGGWWNWMVTDFSEWLQKRKQSK